jgi:SNF2 family DNA or RNA helicase
MQNLIDKMTKRYRSVPYLHQMKCLEEHGEKHAFALLAEMGTGKTATMIYNMVDLWLEQKLTDVLIFAPNGVHSNWTRLEIPKHVPDYFMYTMATWSANLNWAGQRKLKKLMEKESSTENVRILAMNWESIQTKRGFEIAKKFCIGSNKLMIICDESDNIKNPEIKRTKALFTLKTFSKYRRIMTGTPVNNSPFDVFSQFSFLDEKILGTRSFISFKKRFSEQVDNNSVLVEAIRGKTGSTPFIVAKGQDGKPKYKNLDVLAKMIAPYSFRILKEECLDLPKKVYKTIDFELTPEQKKFYKTVEEECRVVFEGDTTVLNKLTALLKLSQITSGYCVIPGMDEPIRISGGNPKLDLLEEWVEKIIKNGEKVIIWARFRIEIKDIVARLKKLKGAHIVEYHGGTSKNDREFAIDSFENGESNIFVGSQQAGGSGITLIAASYVIYFSNNFKLRDRLQSEDRAHRIGQTKSVVYINLCATDTIDEYIINSLMNKKDIAEEILDVGRYLKDKENCDELL